MADLSWWLERIGRIPLLTPAEEIELGNAVQAWLQHPDGPDACPPGIRRRGRRAKDRFINANLRLAVSYVAKHCHRLAKRHSADDLIQAANLGLITAVERFDPTRGYRFSTYAYWWIRQAVGRWIDLHGRVIAIPGSHSQHLGRLGPITRRLQLELNRDPTRDELAAELGVSRRVLEQVIANGKPVASLHTHVHDEDALELGDAIPSWDTSLEDQEEQEERWRQAEQMRSLIRKLPARDQMILSLAWGLDGEQLERRELAIRLGWRSRQLDTHLTMLQHQLRQMTVQLVLVAVKPTPQAAKGCEAKRRRAVAVAGQLSLFPATAAAPSADARHSASPATAAHRPALAQPPAA